MISDLRSAARTVLGFAAITGIAASTALGAGGANPASAVVIPALPFADTGDTTGGSDDWDETCPYTGSTSPDVWYSYTPAVDEVVAVSLCESGYDTKVYILDDSFLVVGCNDDACASSGGGGFRSNLLDITLTAGTTYLVAVDGSGGNSGSYDLFMDLYVPCIFTFECVGTPEGEPCDDSGAPDTINGGCNSTPAVFGSVDCGGTICGTAWALGGNRDTDWYEVDLGGTWENVSLSVIAEAALTIVTLTGINNGICGTVEALQSQTIDPCIEGSVTEFYEPGDAYLWIGHSDFDTLPCGGEKPGNDYIMTVTCSFQTVPCCDHGDANGDGEVGFADLVRVLDNWGPCPGV